MRILTVTQMEVANQHSVPTHNLVQYKDQMATEIIEAHAMRAKYASEMVLVKFQVLNNFINNQKGLNNSHIYQYYDYIT